MVGVYNYTVIATYLGLASGAFGIFEAINGNVKAALVCLMIAGIVDTFDGKIARTKKDRTETEIRFGVQIDALCDVINFGVLPPVICYAAGLIHTVHIVLYIFYILAGVIRLGYFNVLAEEDAGRGGQTVYHGMPVTSACLILPTAYLVGQLLPGLSSAILCFTLLLEAVLFISPIRVKKPNMPTVIVMIAIGVAELALLLAGGRG